MLQIVGFYKYMPTKRITRRTAHSSTREAEVLALARQHGLLRSRDLQAAQLPRAYLARLCARGQLERIARGLYRLPGHPATAGHSLAQVGKRLPEGVICLLSALRFHEMTTQAPAQVWVAIDRKARRPKVADLPVRRVRFAQPLLAQGVVTQLIEGVPVRVTTPARTVADCFKYRHKIGLDVALEALEAGVRERRFGLDELWAMARLCRVANVLRPYLEAVTR